MLTTTTSLAQEKHASICNEQVRINFQGRSPEMLNKLIELGAVSLGDAGEAADWEKYLNHFRSFITYFDTIFTDQQLINIIGRNECPLVTCYAFHSLVKSKDKSINDKTVQDLLLNFAKDTTSYVYLDWGCSSSLIQMFDYLLSLVTDKRANSYLADIRPLTKMVTEKILEERRPYFSNHDIYGQESTWQSYYESFLR